jgi:molybdate transport system substrate-binding protein
LEEKPTRMFVTRTPLASWSRLRRLCLMLAVVALSVTVGCGRMASSPPIAPSTAVPTAQGRLLVSAAVSLKDALEDLKLSYQAQNPVPSIVYNFGASGALQQQIENGAPADVFISAAVQQMDQLEKKGLLVAGTRTNLAGNQLVLIVPIADSKVQAFADLTQPEVQRVVIGEPRSVPAGKYAEQTLRSLKLWESVQPKLVLANTVRQVLASVESGNAAAGLVYATDAKVSPRVKVVAIANPQNHAPIVYPMAVLNRSRQPIAAQAWVRFLTSETAKNTLKKYGFRVPQS